MSTAARPVFLSRVSREFGPLVEELRNLLQSVGIEGRTQLSFRQEEDTTTTLSKLSEYIHAARAVVSLIGKLSGGYPSDASLDDSIHPAPPENSPQQTWRQLLPPGFDRLSYTQWEVILARFWKKPLYLYFRDEKNTAAFDQRPIDDLPHQSAFADYLTETLALDRECFADAKDLKIFLLRDVYHRSARPSAPATPQNLPYPPLGSLFMGRDGDMAKLRDALADGARRVGIHMEARVAAAHGLGGIGKTRLACEYAHQHAGDYEALLFVDASSPDTLDRTLAELSTVLVHHVDLPPGAPDDQRRDAVLAWLRAHPRALIIFDNIDDEPAARSVKALLARLPHGHIILTGRIPRWWENVQALHLDVLSPGDSAAFLLQRTTRRIQTKDDPALAITLAEKLDGLALLLEQAASYINDREITLAAYLREWEQRHHECLDWWDEMQSRYEGGQRPYGRSVLATWLTSVSLLTPEARLLLDLCAHFSHEPIPEWILESPDTVESWAAVAAEPAGSGGLRPPSIHEPRSALSLSPYTPGGEVACGKTPEGGQSPPLPVSPRAPADALRSLIASGLATRTHTGLPDAPHSRAFVLHRILQDVTRQHQLTADRHAHLRLRAIQWMDNLFAGDVGEVANWPQFDPLVPHALLLAQQAETDAGPATTAPGPADLPPQHRLAGHLYLSLALWTSSHGDIHQDADWARRAVTRLHAALGPEHPDTLASRHKFANALSEMGRDSEAEPEHRAVIALRQRLLGPDHAETLRNRNDLANVLHSQGKYGESGAEHRAVFAIRRRVFGAEHADTLASRHNLATSLRDDGDYCAAEREDRTILQIRERTIGRDHPDTLKSRHNLAISLLAQNRPHEAEEQNRLVLEVRQRILGPEHPDTLKARANLSVALMKRPGGLEEAEAEASSVLAIQQRILGEDHPETLGSRNIFQSILKEAGKFAEAETELTALLTARQRVLGHQHPDALSCQVDLAELFRRDGRYREADALLNQVTPILKETLGPEHRLTRAAERLGAQTLMFWGMSDEARLEKNISLLEAKFGPDNSTVINLRSRLGRALLRQLRFRAAEEQYRKVYMQRLRVLGLAHPHTLSSCLELCWCLWMLSTDPNFRHDPDKGRAYVDEAVALAVGAGSHAMEAFDSADPNLVDFYQRLRDVQQQLLGPEHIFTIQNRMLLATVLLVQRRSAEAESEFRALLPILESSPHADFFDIQDCRTHLGYALRDQNKHMEAESEYRAVLAVLERELGPEDPHTLKNRANLAEAQRAQGKYAEAETEHRVALAGRERELGPEHPDTQLSHFNLCLCLESLADEQARKGKKDPARALWREALGHARTAQAAGARVFGAEHPYLAMFDQQVAELEGKLGE